MHYFKKTYKYCLFALTASFLFSCQEELDEQSTNELSDSGWEIRYNEKGDYLEFETYDMFQETVDKLGGEAATHNSMWQKQFALTSLNDIYEQALLADQRYFSEMEKLYEEGKITVEEVEGTHSSFVNKHKNLFLYDSEGHFYMNIFQPSIAKLVNKSGIVKIGNVLVQYTRYSMKSLENGGQKI